MEKENIQSILNQMEQYAKENHVPIIRKDTLDFLKSKIQEIGKQKQNISQDNMVRILELGTAIGYSAIQMCTVFPNIHIDTIEKYDDIYQMANDNIQKANMQDMISSYNADAKELIDYIYLKEENEQNILNEKENLFQIEDENLEQIADVLLNQDYDLIFIDANKSYYLYYFQFAQKLLERANERRKEKENGSDSKKEKSVKYILCDNVLYQGKVLSQYNEKKHRTAVNHLREFLGYVVTDKYDTALYSKDDGFTLTRFCY